MSIDNKFRFIINTHICNTSLGNFFIKLKQNSPSTSTHNPMQRNTPKKFSLARKNPPTKILLHRAEISYFQKELPMKVRELKVTYLWTLAYAIVGVKLVSSLGQFNQTIHLSLSE